jgi:hypothetical protein
MTKILILSDSHDAPSVIASIVKQEIPFDELVFCGDGIQDLSKADLPSSFIVNSVIGNVDRARGYLSPEQLHVKISGKKFFITHGDLFGVKHGIEKLRHHAMTAGADCVFFGHTHIPLSDTSSHPYLVNPGSSKLGDYCVVTINGSEIKPVLKSLS